MSSSAPTPGPRFAVLKTEQLNAAQKKTLDSILSGPRAAGDPGAADRLLNGGPFNVWLRSPELGLRVLDSEGHVVVMDVDPRGPAAAAGVQSGDRVAELDGVPIAKVVDDDLVSLDDLDGFESSASSGPACPSCGGPMEPEAILCTGYLLTK